MNRRKRNNPDISVSIVQTAEERMLKSRLGATESFVKDLGVVFPAILDQYTGNVYGWGVLTRYRVSDVHDAAESIRAQTTADRAAALLAEFRGEKAEPVTGINGGSSIKDAVERIEAEVERADRFGLGGGEVHQQFNLSRVVVERGTDVAIACSGCRGRVVESGDEDLLGGQEVGGDLAHDSSPSGSGPAVSAAGSPTVTVAGSVDASPVGGVAGVAGGVTPATVNPRAVERGRVMAEVRSQLRAAFRRGDEAELGAWAGLLSREFHQAMLAHEDAVEAAQIRAEEVRE